jgi:hypothetical protein
MNKFTENFIIPIIISVIPGIIHNWWVLNWQWWAIVIPTSIVYALICNHYDNRNNFSTH